MKKEEKELLFANCFAEKHFLEGSWKAEKATEPIDVIVTTTQGTIALELTVIATNPEGHKRKAYTDLVVSELQARLQEAGIKVHHYCICFQSGAQRKFPERRNAVLELSEFIVRNSPKGLEIHQRHDFEIPYVEKINDIVESISVIQMGPGYETDVCQVGAFWSGGLSKETVQKKIVDKNRLLPEKRRLHPDIPHWLIMVIENHEGSSAAFWEEHANDTFLFDYDACFILELAPPKYIQLRRAGAN